jgi:hypothetical protein
MNLPNDEPQPCLSFQNLNLPDLAEQLMRREEEKLSKNMPFDAESSIIGKDSHASKSTAQFKSIERMRDSLVKFEINHKLKQTMKGFNRLDVVISQKKSNSPTKLLVLKPRKLKKVTENLKRIR